MKKRKTKKDEKEEKKNIALFGLASLLNDLGSDIIAALTPIYLKQINGTEFIPLASAIREGVPLIINNISYKISSKIGRLETSIFGYSLSSLSKWLMVMSATPTQFLTSLTADRIGKGLRDPPRDSILSNMEEKKKAFSIHQAMDTLGSSLGMLILLLIPLTIKEFLLLAAMIASLSIFPLFFVKTKTYETKESHPIQPIFLFAALPFYGITIPLSFADTKEESAIFFFIYNIASTIFSYIAYKHKESLSLSYLILAIASITFTINLPLAFILYGTAIGLFKVSSIYLISQLSKGNVKSMGRNEALLGLSFIASNLLFGGVESIIKEKAYIIFSIISSLYFIAFLYFKKIWKTA